VNIYLDRKVKGSSTCDITFLFVFYIYIRKIKNKNTKKIQEKVGLNGVREKWMQGEKKKQNELNMQTKNRPNRNKKKNPHAECNH
jgi:hypothetical protein